MTYILILFAVQCFFTAAVVIVLKKLWNRELIKAALDKFESCQELPDIKEIDVRSAFRISEDFKNHLESICRRKMPRARLNIQEDRSLKGGIVITAGGFSLDFSLSSR